MGIAIAETWGGVGIAAAPKRMAASGCGADSLRLRQRRSRVSSLFTQMGPEQRKRGTMAAGLAEDATGT